MLTLLLARCSRRYDIGITCTFEGKTSFQGSSGQSSCSTCKSCAVGEFVSTPCSLVFDTSCSDCAAGKSGNAGWVRWLLGAAAEVAATHDLTLTVHC